MNLYMIYPNKKYENDEVYDIFNSAIVAAETINDAKTIHPSGDYYYNKNVHKWCYYDIVGRDSFLEDDNDDWPLSISHISATLIGKAKEGTERGVILASFNAG